MASDVLNRFVQKREEPFHSERKTFQTCPVIQTNAQYDVTLYGTTFPTSLHFIYAWLNSYKPAWKLYIDSNMSCESHQQKNQILMEFSSLGVYLAILPFHIYFLCTINTFVAKTQFPLSDNGISHKLRVPDMCSFQSWDALC